MLMSLEHPIPHPTLLPAVEAAGNSSPRTIALRKIAPRCSGAIYPEHTVYDTPMIAVGAASFGLSGGQERLQEFPLLVCQISSCHATSVPAHAFCKHTLAEPRPRRMVQVFYWPSGSLNASPSVSCSRSSLLSPRL